MFSKVQQVGCSLRPATLRGAVRPLWLVSGAVGLAGGGGWGRCYCGVSAACLAAASLLVVARRLLSPAVRRVHAAVEVTYTAASTLKMIFCVACPAVAAARPRALQHIFSRLEKCDQQLLVWSGEDASRLYRRELAASCVLAAGTVVALLAWSAAIPPSLGALQAAVQLWKAIVMAVLVMQYSSLMLILAERYKRLHKRMEGLLNVIRNRKENVSLAKFAWEPSTETIRYGCSIYGKVDPVTSEVRLIRQLYFELFSISVDINSFFSLQLFLLIIHLFFGIVHLAFLIALFVQNRDTSTPSGSSTEDAFYNAGMLAQKAAVLAAVVGPSARAAAAAGAARRPLVAASLHSGGVGGSGSLAQELLLFAHQLALTPPPTTGACGFFALDHSLLSAMATSVVTYTIFLIQLN